MPVTVTLRPSFGPWHPLADAADVAPRTAGVVQVRQRDGLLIYPRGRSAMVCYAAAADVAATVASLAALAGPADPDGGAGRWLVRWSASPVRDPDDAVARLLADFTARFGAPPRGWSASE